MSILNQIFNRGLLGPKCKTCLNLAISRIKLLQNKRDNQLKLMRKEISQFLQAGQEPIARIRVEHVIREQNIWAAYEIVEMFCEFVLARVPILESQKDCPTELCEAVASIVFAAPRCSDLPDLLHVRNLFAAKYGKEFIAAASELRPDTSVNRTIVEKLSVSAPSAEVRLKVLKDIAREYNVDWDSSETEKEFKKTPEDLLNGPKQVFSPRLSSQESLKQPIVPAQKKETSQVLQPPSSAKPVPFPNKSETSSVSTNVYATKCIDIVRETRPESCDALEKARAAIAAAEQATASARAAALLVNANFGSQTMELQKS